MYTIDQFNHRNVNDQASLTAALAWASYKYYVENESVMPDEEFDMEFKKLQALEQASGKVLPDSPTQRVGSDIQDGFEKRKHVIPMQSIENVYNDEELQEWLASINQKLHAAFPKDPDGISYTYEPKYDGLSISLVYRNGKLDDAVTRGNQLEGDSVYNNVRTIRNVPLILPSELIIGDPTDLFAERIDMPEYFEVRGEVLMPQGAFDRLNAEKIAAGEKPFANKRNAASGSLKVLDPKITSKRGLVVNAYAAYSTDLEFQSEVLSSQEKTLQILGMLGFDYYKTPGSQSFSDLAALTNAINDFNVVRTSHQLPYDCDGVVIKVNQRRHQEFLGLNTTFPNWCKARKFPQEAQSTKINDVTFQIGMTGHVTPVAELEPTGISGSVVSRATLNNESYIQQLGLKIGAYVFVQKAGEVIPQVTGVDAVRTYQQEESAEAIELRDIEFPELCPCCQTPLVKKGEYWICPNHHCKQQVIQRLEYWCGKDCANIKGLGPGVIEDLYDKLGIASVDDLYRVFVTLDGDDMFYHASIQEKLEIKEKKGSQLVENIFNNVRASIQTLTLDRIIGGLGIDGVGKITGRMLAQHFGTLDALSRATLEDLVMIEGIGEIMARNILDFFDPETGHTQEYACIFGNSHASLIPHQLSFNTTYQAAEKLGDALEGLTIIFTGTSYRFKRDEIKTFFMGHGAKYVGSVSGKVSYVVTGDSPGQNKLDKAQELGIPVIPEREFYEQFNL